MKYRFNDFELDIERFELRRDGRSVDLEPQVFSLLAALVQQADRLLSKNEIVEQVWGGDAVSDDSISNRIKLARQAIGDDGKTQHSIRTVHGRGFRFVANVEVLDEQNHSTESKGAIDLSPGFDPSSHTDEKPSIAVLPFLSLGPVGDYTALADAIPHELIQALARLRWLLVIARGSTFQFRDSVPDVKEVGRLLNVGYCLAGSIEVAEKTVTITVELSDTSNASVVWGERFVGALYELQDLRTDILANVAAALEVHIPANEASRAGLQSAENLNAWANYHLGLKQMFRFSKIGNARAEAFFERAIGQDPHFARAHAGLSFTQFINAFVKFSDRPDEAVVNARRHAERALELDSHDPFANLTMGRAFWLSGEMDKSIAWLDRALTLSPNYAQAFYSRGFADMIRGGTGEARNSVDLGVQLSPLDPLLYGMLGTRALTFITEGNYQDAGIWADKAAQAPGAHYLISMIAVVAHTLNNDDAKLRPWLDDIHTRRVDANRSHFFDAFPLLDTDTRKRVSDALTKHGF